MKIRILRGGLLSIGMLFSFSFLSASEPDGYYQDAYGKSGFALKTALHDIIKGHTSLSYDGLWGAYKQTDARNGKVWDMYSDCNFSFGGDQCSNYKSECDCYNREHSFPKSWFDDAKPMYTDLFHLYPTDGKVNGMRSNNPFGEVGNATYVSGNGSKLGNNTTSGYSGKVFEPVDEYKGDFARSYFYMATRYEDKIASWSSCPVCAGNNKASFKQWTIDLLLKWHRQDPVSQKEKDRNDAVYNYQHNRNPFIDYPQLVEKIWGDDKTVFDPDDPNPPVGPEDPDTSVVVSNYEIWYEYHDAQGNIVEGSDHMLAVQVPQAGRAVIKGGVLMDEDFSAVDEEINSGTPATVENTGARYVESFDGKAYLSGKSAVRLGSGSAAGSVTFKEIDVDGDFTVTISGKGWGGTSNEYEFTLECQGCTQASQKISFTKSKDDLTGTDQYEDLAPVRLTANGKARLSISAAGKPRVILDRVTVAGNGGGVDPGEPGNPSDTTANYTLKVLYPQTKDTVKTASVSARVALLDRQGRQLGAYDLQSVELPEEGDYVFWTLLVKDEEELNEQLMPFVYSRSGSEPENPGVAVEIPSETDFAIHPNPTSGKFVLEMSHDDNLVEIFSMKGNVVLRRRHVGERFEASLSRSGVYFVRVTNVFGGAVRRLVVK